ncbi:hypothetical protein B4N89_44655 [Embleya scabrispora]|uniref:Uncharacterized protein n=1 Tax=Embleya scabrispora TaxID=159449 RepID=A0A1T3NLG6_9ACTN|nr:hypothetical protein [Embleya scabrispora]OPC77582.1 hypothetical protein B4N89_44655 [Embleya scabrispora]
MNNILGPEARQLWLVIGVLVVVVRAPLGALMRGFTLPEPHRHCGHGYRSTHSARGKGGGR